MAYDSLTLSPVLDENASLGVTLDRYQELMRLPIAAFNGLNKPDEEPVYECSTIWKQSERDALVIALYQAEEMREQELTYHIAPKYDVLQNQDLRSPLILEKKHLIKLGLRTISTIQAGVALTLGTLPALNDPVIITVATTVTDKSEIKVYYPGEAVEIHPSFISISGGTATIKIPRSRLVLQTVLDNRDDHLYYDDNANFLTTVDVKRVYYDTTNPGQYVWLYSCDTNTIAETTQGLYARITNNRLSVVEHYPATYASGVWTKACWTLTHYPDYITMYSYSGRQLSVYTEMQTIRLAHTLMPNAPCSCPTVHQYWQMDVESTDTLTPYGSTKGAVDVWSKDARAKVGQGGKFPRVRGY